MKSKAVKINLTTLKRLEKYRTHRRETYSDLVLKVIKMEADGYTLDEL